MDGRFIIFATKEDVPRPLFIQVEAVHFKSAVILWRGAEKLGFISRVWDRKQEKFLSRHVLISAYLVYKEEENDA